MDKVFCPYCGKCMNPKLNKLGFHAYECTNCFSVSPIAATNDDAMAMAQTRVKPLQKPLTLEEAKKELALWFEYPPNIYNHRAYLYPELYSSDFRAESTYGIGWRCWATKPTDEEREAAKWEE